MLGKLLELERDLAGVMNLEDMSGTVLDKLQKLSGAAGAALFSFDPLGAVRIHGGSLAGAMSGYSADLFPEDALQQWSMRLPPGTFLSDGSHQLEGKPFDLAVHVRSRPYADFYRPLDIAFVMGIWPLGKPYGAPDKFGVILTLGHPFRPFPTSVTAQLRHLEEPFRLAARRIAQFRALEQKADMLARLPERGPGAFVLWDPAGQLVWASASAQRHLESRLRRSDLERAARLARGQLRPRVSTAYEGLLGRPRQLRSAGSAPTQVAFSWLSGADGRPWLLAEIQESNAHNSPLHELTRAETRVLQLLSRGLSNSEIGEQLGISQETVKTHLKRVFHKLGVSSRAKAVHFLSRHSTFRGS